MTLTERAHLTTDRALMLSVMISAGRVSDNTGTPWRRFR
jgi:hypothetical protein